MDPHITETGKIIKLMGKAFILNPMGLHTMANLRKGKGREKEFLLQLMEINKSENL